jgi:SAM-dependent methyltransferase
VQPPRHDGFYDDAEVYDILHAPGTDTEVDGLERIARRYSGSRANQLWLEPACGSGRYLREAAARGYEVVGFDSNPGMVAYARRELQRAGATKWAILEADLTRFASGLAPSSVDFAFNLQNTIRHLPHDQALLDHLEEMSRVLRGGGVYAVGIDLVDYANAVVTEDVWHARRGGCEVSQVVQYVPPPRDGTPRLETVIGHLVIRREEGVEHRDYGFTLRTYDVGEWESVIARSALEMVDVVDESGHSTRERPFAYGIHLLRGRGRKPD